MHLRTKHFRSTLRERPRRSWLGLVLVTVLALSPIAGLDLAAQSADRGFLVIVHRDNPVTEVDSSRLQKMFLKKSKRWDDDVTVVAFDLDEDSEVRETFTREIHGKSVSAIKSYWQRMIFSGRDVPLEELASDDEVIERVAAERGGLGYVSSSATLDDDVKAITIED